MSILGFTDAVFKEWMATEVRHALTSVGWFKVKDDNIRLWMWFPSTADVRRLVRVTESALLTTKLGETILLE